MEAVLALMESVESGVELLHRLEVIFWNGYAAHHMKEITDSRREIGCEHRYLGGMRCAGGNKNGGTIQKIDVVGQCDKAVFELLFVLTEVLPAVHTQTHTEIEIGAE